MLVGVCVWGGGWVGGMRGVFETCDVLTLYSIGICR